MAGKLTCVNIETTQASSVVTPSIAGEDSGWQDAAREGGTVVGYVYRKLPTGMVVINFTAATVSGSLPVGYCPLQSMLIPVISDTSDVGAVLIGSTGAVSPTVTLNNTGYQPITFFAEA